MSMQTLERALSGHPDIHLAIVFGSVAEGQARVDSDIDVAVQGDAPLDAERKMALIRDVAEATGRSVDLVDLKTVGEPLRGEILRHGHVLFDRRHALVDLMLRHVYDMEDFVPYLRRLFKERQHPWIA